MTEAQARSVSKSFQHTHIDRHVDMGSDRVSVSLIRGKAAGRSGVWSRGELVRFPSTGPFGAVLGSRTTRDVLSDAASTYSTTGRNARRHAPSRGVSLYREKYQGGQGPLQRSLTEATQRQRLYIKEKTRSTQPPYESELFGKADAPNRSTSRGFYSPRMELVRGYQVDLGPAKNAAAAPVAAAAVAAVDGSSGDDSCRGGGGGGGVVSSPPFFEPPAVNIRRAGPGTCGFDVQLAPVSAASATSAAAADRSPADVRANYSTLSLLHPFKRRPLVWRDHLRAECRFHAVARPQSAGVARVPCPPPSQPQPQPPHGEGGAGGEEGGRKAVVRPASAGPVRAQAAV